jgi:hypothetical protein
MDHGRFRDAELQLQSVRELWPELECMARLLEKVQETRERGRNLSEKMHRAMTQDRWSDVLNFAEQILTLAPNDPIARHARQEAWSKVGTILNDSRRLNGSNGRQTLIHRPADAPHETAIKLEGDTVVGQQAGRQFMVWVDAVGGFWVCTGSEVTIGQAVQGNDVDVPIQADISRRHAKIRREGEGYLLEALQATRVDGQPVAGTTLLKDGDEIELGGSVRLRFRRPHALSASARLEFLTRHKTKPGSDAVLLMAESCVLGPHWQNHVVCRDWSGDVVLYRQDADLYCRAMESIEIDGNLCDGRGKLGANSRIVGSDFSLSLEAIT